MPPLRIVHPDPMPPLPAVYATPRQGVALDDCWFYHTIDLPGHDTLEGQWDLRAGVEDYLGGVDFAGQRVLEMGTASGMLCFAMEQRGAEVVAFDLASHLPWDIVPLALCPDLGHCLRYKAAELERLRNSYWYCHEALDSQARVVYGSVYDVPADIGPVDVVTFGSILLHLRDPFLALANAVRLARRTVIVTDMLPASCAAATPPTAPRPWWRRLLAGRQPALPAATNGPVNRSAPHLTFLPSGETAQNVDTWWHLSPAVVQRFLAVLGFEESRVSSHSQPYQGRPTPLFTVVASRTRPMPRRLDGPYPWY